MSERKFTAQEMREMATVVFEGSEFQDDGCTVVYRDIYCGKYQFSPSTVEAMLRYAAEVVERCDKKRKELDEEWFYEGAYELTMPMEDCYKIIDYILRGDAEEGA